MEKVSDIGKTGGCQMINEEDGSGPVLWHGGENGTPSRQDGGESKGKEGGVGFVEGFCGTPCDVVCADATACHAVCVSGRAYSEVCGEYEAEDVEKQLRGEEVDGVCQGHFTPSHSLLSHPCPYISTASLPA